MVAEVVGDKLPLTMGVLSEFYTKCARLISGFWFTLELDSSQYNSVQGPDRPLPIRPTPVGTLNFNKFKVCSYQKNKFKVCCAC